MTLCAAAANATFAALQRDTDPAAIKIRWLNRDPCRAYFHHTGGPGTPYLFNADDHFVGPARVIQPNSYMRASVSHVQFEDCLALYC